MNLLTPREGQALPPCRPSVRHWQSQVLGKSDSLGCDLPWSRVMDRLESRDPGILLVVGADPSDKNLLREIGVTQSIWVDVSEVTLASVTSIA